MIAIIAPARNLCPLHNAAAKPTPPLFMEEAMRLVEYLRAYSPWQLESLLDVPPERAFTLYDAYQNFSVRQPGTPALLSYYGAAYRNMAPQNFSGGELAFAQEHLRILSALYGLLRPLDGILQHRLGLKRDFFPGGQSLYAFWGAKLCKELYKTGELVLNLASVDYAKLIIPHMQSGGSMLSCRFLVQKPGKLSATVSSIRAARGLMTAYFIQNHVTRPEELKDFTADGYHYSQPLSSAAQYVFVKMQSETVGKATVLGAERNRKLS